MVRCTSCNQLFHIPAKRFQLKFIVRSYIGTGLTAISPEHEFALRAAARRKHSISSRGTPENILADARRPEPPFVHVSSDIAPSVSSHMLNSERVAAACRRGVRRVRIGQRILRVRRGLAVIIVQIVRPSTGPPKLAASPECILLCADEVLLQACNVPLSR